MSSSSLKCWCPGGWHREGGCPNRVSQLGSTGPLSSRPACESRTLYLGILGPFPADRDKDIGVRAWGGGGCTPGDSHGPGLPVTPRGVLQFIIPPPDDGCLQRKEQRSIHCSLSSTVLGMWLGLPAATKSCLFDENVQKFSVTWRLISLMFKNIF